MGYVGHAIVLSAFGKGKCAIPASLGDNSKTTSQVAHNIYTIYGSYDTKYCSFGRFFGKKNGILPCKQDTELNMFFKILI